MVDSVNSNTGSTSVSTDTSSTVTNEDEVQGVSSGFSGDNTSSYAESTASEGVDSSVSLNSPASSTTSGTDFLQKSFDARLNNFKNIVSDFNARFDPEAIDLSDTRSLLMALKGAISDMRALLSAQSIDQDASNRNIQQQKRLDAARTQRELKGEISDRQEAIDSSVQQVYEKDAEMVQKLASKAQKEQELTAATADGDTDLVNQLQSEITALQSDITQLEYDVASLSQVIQQLEAENLVSKANVAALQQVVDFVAVEFVSVKNILGKVRERYDAAAVVTGEEQRARTRVENKQAEVNLSREGQRLQEKKVVMKDTLRADIADEKAAIERQQEQISPQANLAGLSQNQVGTLAALFPPENPTIILQKLKENPGQPAPEQISDTAEALSLVIQAEAPAPKPEPVPFTELSPEPSVTASEENPGEQPYLGDNLSLEGANNPQAFALLLREQNMVQLTEKVQDTEQLMQLEAQQNAQILELMDQLQLIDAIVSEALEEAAAADAVIRRSPV